MQGEDEQEAIPHPQHWRNRAEYARTDAAKIIDPISRRTMLGIAESYESLAQWTEQKLRELFRRGVGVR